MSTLKFIAFDVRNGIARYWWKYLVAFGVSLLFSLALSSELSRAQQQLGLPTAPPTLGDCLVNLVAGIPRYVFDAGYPFPFPASWLLVFLLVAYLTLAYPYRDLMGSGRQLVLASGSRLSWWASKCVWAALSVLAFFLALGVGAVLWTVIAGGDLGLQVSAAAPTALSFGIDRSVLHPWQVGGWFFAAAVLVTIALCLVQMLVSLVIKPLLSFVVTVAILFFSAFFQTDALVGSYLMAARSSYFVNGGMQAPIGVAIALGIIVVAAVIGGLYFKNMDIMEGAHES